MSSGISPNLIFPRHFILRPGVSSPLTTRYPKHGQSASPQGRSAATTSRGKTAGKAGPDAEALRRRLQENEDFLAKLLFRLRDFPDAADAISEILKPLCSPNNEPADFAYD